MRKIILFELNEVPFGVVDYFCSQFPESALARTLPKCTQVETVTHDEGELSPWITWPTLHRGVSNHQHKIKDFGEDLGRVDGQFPPVWQILAEAGLKPGVFASMHTFPMPGNYQDYSFFVPDPFAGDSAAHPGHIEPFQQFNLAMSRKSGRNVDSGIDFKAALNLAKSLPWLGLKPETFVAVGKQLLDERTSDWKKNRRRVFQSVLAFDVFYKLLKDRKPNFTTFFSNHVASTMHRYWAATFPEDYSEYNLSDEWQQRFAGEIAYAMHWFDAFFKRLKQFADNHPEYLLVVASSMGQEATKAEELKTELYGENFEKFVACTGLQASEWERKPAMHPQYNLSVVPEKEDFFLQQLRKFRVNGEPLVFRHKENGFFSINLGHRNMEKEELVFDEQTMPFSTLGLKNEPVDDESDGTAYHIPEGILLIYDPKETSLKTSRQTSADSRAVAPSLLDNFGLSVPDYMVEERIVPLTGKSLKAGSLL